VTDKKQIEVIYEGNGCSVIRDREDNSLSLVIPAETMNELWDVFVEAEEAVREVTNGPASLRMEKLCGFIESLIFSYSGARTAYMAEQKADPEKREAYAKLLAANKMLRELKKFHRPEK